MSKPSGEPQPQAQDDLIKIPDVLPVLPLKDTVVFPYIILPLSVGRDKSVLAVDRALAESRVIMLVAQRDAANDNPKEEDLFQIGTAAVIMRMLKLPDGRIRILVQGLSRARVQHISQVDPYLQAKIQRIDEPPIEIAPLEIEALVRSVKE
ncbi:MAG TPA: LON peptidase substrate-binding domain-containing protein, partial [Thermoanaerobaculia bacterium]|nr:LON peptidase substrate-binding domain-containing protein [Thermoanaerobaculia bacterium]